MFIFKHCILFFAKIPKSTNPMADKIWREKQQAKCERKSMEIEKKLQFTHIPKNAGTTVEFIGLDYNICWGVWQTKKLTYYSDLVPSCQYQMWHSPPRGSIKSNIDNFCIVRNPYRRILSIFRYYRTLTAEGPWVPEIDVKECTVT